MLWRQKNCHTRCEWFFWYAKFKRRPLSFFLFNFLRSYCFPLKIFSLALNLPPSTSFNSFEAFRNRLWKGIGMRMWKAFFNIADTLYAFLLERKFVFFFYMLLSYYLRFPDFKTSLSMCLLHVVESYTFPNFKSLKDLLNHSKSNRSSCDVPLCSANGICSRFSRICSHFNNSKRWKTDRKLILKFECPFEIIVLPCRFYHMI